MPGLDVRAQLRAGRLARLQELRLESNVLRLSRLRRELRLLARGRQRVGNGPEALVHASLTGLHVRAVCHHVVVARGGEGRVEQIIIRLRHHQTQQRVAAVGSLDARALRLQAVDDASLAGVDRGAEFLDVRGARRGELLVQANVGVRSALIGEDRRATLLAHLRIVELALQALDDAPAARGDALAHQLRLGRALGLERELETPVAAHPHLALEELGFALGRRLRATRREAGPQAPLPGLHPAAVFGELRLTRERQTGVLADVPRGGHHLLVNLRLAALVVDVAVAELSLEALEDAPAGAHLGLGGVQLGAAHGLHGAHTRLAQVEVQAPVRRASHDASIEHGAAVG